ncbi:Uncharacterized protein APZ42_014140 [Daphnia magna]|uniref:Uncharacterized protein n=1 Tax=Daphnia magna TaxID=35525 RepID=A0A162PZR2_9CRUS|nr:Uncharacterized protein APZ42_014140 [Daphnia magna]
MGLLICPLNPVVESRLQPSSDTLLCSRASFFLTSSTSLLTCSLQSQQLSSSSVAPISPSTSTTTTTTTS